MALVGVVPDFPQISFDSGGRVDYKYDAASNSGAFKFENTLPIFFQASSASAQVNVLPPRSFSLEFRTDGSGNLTGGIAGDDMSLVGSIDLNGDTIPEYSGVLLTGEMERFGFAENPGLDPDTDTFDFLLTPTGGDLAPLLGGRKIGIRVSAEPSTPNFTGSFQTDFRAVSKGSLGAFAFGALGDKVFLDQDADGVQDTSEPGVPNVLVELLNSAGAVVATQQTDASGNYLFTDLATGAYSVRFNAPAGSLLTFPNSGSDDALDSDAVPNTARTFGVSQLVLIQPNRTNRTVDAGLIPLGAISGYVYADANNNGLKESGETALSGVGLTLTGTDLFGNAVSRTIQTAVDGSYLFGDLVPSNAAGYTVTETQPVGYFDGKETKNNAVAIAGSAGGPDVISGLVLLPGQVDPDNNFGELLAASISGFVYSDADNDGEFDAGEAGIVGATVALTGTDDLGNPVVVPPTTTDASGQYAFTGLRPGTYNVTETQPAGYDDGIDTPGTVDGSPRGSAATNDVLASVILNSGDAGINYNFGERVKLAPATAGIAGFVYVDSDNDGEFDPGEAPIKDVPVNLTGTDDLGQSVSLVTQTLADGSYSFTGLRPGTYTVTETQPGNYFDGKDTAGSLGGDATTNDVIAAIVLPAGQFSFSNNFGERLASLSGTTYEDQSGNGLTPDDLPYKLGSVKVTLYKESNGQPGRQAGDTYVTYVQTDPTTGFYQFDDLGPGTYYAVETTPTGYLRTEPALTGTYTVAATLPQEYPNNDFAYYYNCGCSSSVKNVTYVINGSTTVSDLRGKTNQGDLVTVNFTVSGTRPVELSFVTYTAPSAWFDAGEASEQVVFDEQTGLFAPGNHSMTVQIPNSYYQIDFVCGKVIDVLGPAGSNRFYTPQKRLISADNDGLNPVRSDGSSIGGTVYFDANGTGQLDTGDTGLGMVKVVLTGRTTAGNNYVSLTRYTKPDGSYSFDNLAPGTYTVTQPTQPSGYLDGGETIGSLGGALSGSDAISSIVLTSSSEAVDYNFGETKAGSLSGKVFQDDDEDGNPDSGEAGISGVTITLTGMDVFGRSVSRTTTTGSDGSYRFGDLAPGTYSVAESQPDGFDDWIDSIGSLGGLKPGGSNDLITEIALGLQASGTGYNFAELAREASIGEDTTATIGYWQNPNGQRLLKCVTDARLGNWLATSFPKLFGSGSKYNLAGKNGTWIADTYKNTIFNLSSPKTEAQVWTTAFNVFFTTQSLVGNISRNPFAVSAGGLGSMTINVQSSGTALGITNNTTVTVLTLLQRANAVADGTSNSTLTFSTGSNRRSPISSVFDRVNNSGHV